MKTGISPLARVPSVAALEAHLKRLEGEVGATRALLKVSRQLAAAWGAEPAAEEQQPARPKKARRARKAKSETADLPAVPEAA